MMSTTTEASGRAQRICLVDDDTDNSETTSLVLRAAGYSVESHRNGHAALARLQEQGADLILLDLWMPDMDGWQFRVAQRADHSLRDIPVIVTTGDTSARAAAIHADCSLNKPFGKDELISTVKQVLLATERRRFADSLEQSGRDALLSTRPPHIELPLSQPVPECVSQSVPRGSRRATVWIVDDEPALTRVLERMLGDSYAVSIHESATDVLLRLHADEEFDVLLCDLMMPEMTGIELARRVANEWPTLGKRIIFMSGGMPGVSLNAFIAEPGRLFIEMPFSGVALRALVARVANEGSEASLPPSTRALSRVGAQHAKREA